jgi:hypothetical protein
LGFEAGFGNPERRVSLAAASACIVSVTCEYRSTVVEIVE